MQVQRVTSSIAGWGERLSHAPLVGGLLVLGLRYDLIFH